MTREEKNEFANDIAELIAKEKYDEAANLIMSTTDYKDDYALAMVGVPAILILAGEKPHLYGVCEMLLRFHEREGLSDPEWLYMMAQTMYHQDRYVETIEYLNKLFEISTDKNKYSFAYEMYEDSMKALEENESKYTEQESEGLFRYITTFFGESTFVLGDPNPLGVDIKIVITKPDEFHSYYTAVTLGMGAYKMEVPSEYKTDMPERAELVMYLPADADPTEENYTYIDLLLNLRELARRPYEKKTWVGLGHVFSGNFPIDPEADFVAEVLLGINRNSGGTITYPLENGEKVAFYQVMPLYEEEMNYKLSHSIVDFMQLIKNTDPVYDRRRKNLCKNHKDTVTLLRGELDMLGDMEIGKNCAASRRIIEDGCRVGYMRRIMPERGGRQPVNDSGWMMLAGDESMQYLGDPYHIELTSLNTVCNIDPDIVPYLMLPPGTEVMRAPDGKLYAGLPENRNFDGEQKRRLS